MISLAISVIEALPKDCVNSKNGLNFPSMTVSSNATTLRGPSKGAASLEDCGGGGGGDAT